jgi:mono/diheme cytochrome c family protein
MFALLAFAICACDRPPPTDSLTEWTPGDHHSTDDDKLAPGMRQQAPAGTGQQARQGGSAANGSEVTQLVDLAWRQQCSSCHGPAGKGDGQMGPMMKAPDLTREEWQSQVTDAQIAASIKSGKGKMPAFNMPDPVIEGLVARVRATRGHR